MGKSAASLELSASDVKLLTSKGEMDRRANGEYDSKPDAEPEPQSAKAQISVNGKGTAKPKPPVEDDSDIPF